MFEVAGDPVVDPMNGGPSLYNGPAVLGVSSYPDVYQLGHRAIPNIFDGPVIIEEKIDGSQFSFGIINGQYVCRSHKKTMIPDAPEKMFQKIVDITRALPLHEGWIYRGELVNKLKHNVLSYGRIPKNNLVLFDVMTAPESYMAYPSKVAEAERLGFDVVPLLFQGVVTDYEMFKSFLAMESILGGTLVEGVVIKNYDRFTEEKKPAMGKYVSEAFKEENKRNWRAENPTSKDVATLIIGKYQNKMRWQKAVIHLKEAGALVGAMNDIPLLLKEIPADVEKECMDDIKQMLWDHFWPGIRRGICRGVPEWYKEELAKSAFPEEPK